MSLLNMTLREVRDFLGEGQVVGSPDFHCRSLASLGRAKDDQLSFVKGDRHVEAARASGAGALLVSAPIPSLETSQLVLQNPYLAFGRLLERVAEKKRHHPEGTHPAAHVDETAEIDASVKIGAGAVVREEARVGPNSTLCANVYLGSRSTVGADCFIAPNVVIMEDVHIGDRVRVHGGTVIGADGYGYIQSEGKHLKVPQVGEIVIGDDVEIGALSTIDRATVDQTTIGRGTKIGDMCHVAHNCNIGEDVLLLPTAQMGGSVTVGDRAVFAGRAACIDNLTIGAGATLGATAVAFKDVDPGAVLWGVPARDKTREMRTQVVLQKLPELQKQLRAVVRHLGL
ncbi:MAG: UDP-3-O-(3-hydroxymyristoyl)glucosamine N-acyltransferase [Longimicrobiales bacterium]